MNTKHAEILVDFLKKYSDQKKRKYLGQLNVDTLPYYTILVEKNNRINKVTFQYRADSGKLVRTDFEKKTNIKNYQRVQECVECKNPCYKDAYTVKEFIVLLTEGIFKISDIYTTT